MPESTVCDGCRWYIDGKIEDLRSLIAAQERARDKAEELAREILDTTASGLNDRLQSMNEFRAQLQDQERSYVRRETYEQRHENLEKRVVNLEVARGNIEGRMWAGAALVVVVEFLLRWFNK